MKNNNQLKDISDLHRKIMYRLNSEIVSSSKIIASLSELINAVEYELSIYNNLFINREDIHKKVINKSSGYGKYTPSFIEKKVPRVSRIIPFVNEFGAPFINLSFCYGDGKNIGTITLKDDYKNISYDSLDDLIKNNIELFDMMFDALKYFASEYPSYAYTWDKENKSIYDQEVNDGFICGKINTNEPNKSYVTLYKYDDLELSRIITRQYRELYDYIEMYGNSIMNRTAIEVDTLNPFLKSILNKYRSLSEDKSLTL